MQIPELSSSDALRSLSRLMLVLSVVGAGCGRNQVDLVVHNAVVYTVDDANPRASAFAVNEGRFVAVGQSEDILAEFSGRDVLDAGGRAVVPGFIDAHAHLMGRGIARLEVDLTGTTSIDDVIARLRTHAARLPGDAWLTGRGWDQNDWEEPVFPDRYDLDAAFPDRPVWLGRIDGHAYWANTATIRAVGEDRIRNASDTEGGRIFRDSRGEPTGIFVDGAADLVKARRPGVSEELLRSGLREALEETARFGLTGVHDPGAEPDTIEAYREAVRAGTFTIRAYVAVEGLGAAFRTACEHPIRDDQDVLVVRSVKFYADGALGSRGAALLHDYSDEPGNRGLLFRDADRFREELTMAIDCGFQVMTHAIGDRANRMVLDAYEEVRKRLPNSDLRLRIEHAQMLTEQDVARFAELGVIASVQPTHATSDMYWAEDRVGAERIEWAYPWRSLADHGVRLALGSDAPVESMNPLLGIYAAVTRQDVSGWPPGAWYPAQRLSREEALAGFTLGAAYAAFMENQVGSIEEGKFADFVLLDRDVMVIPADEIPEARVSATFLGGQAIYRAGGL